MSRYGETFAQKLLQRGDYPEAAAAATRHLAQDPESPEPYFDRARALAALGQHAEAIDDFARALERDRDERILPDDELDDGLFSTLIAWAQGLPAGAPADERLRILSRYQALLPHGSHASEAADWALRFRGALKETWVKPRD